MSAFYNVDQPPFNMGSTARAIAAANNGLLFDPSDMSTMYQDAAGTTPVTAVEQPVGKILDKSGNGNHATQSITASRPVLSARKNVLLATDVLATQSVTAIAAKYTLSFTGTGSVTLSGAATGTLTGTGADNRVSLTVTPTAGTLTLTVSGSVTKAQLELGTSAGPYQRVNTATDYDTDERYFPKYLRFDGVDDYLNLPYMGLYANGSASVVAARDWINVVGEPAFICESSTLDNNPVYWPINCKNGSLRTLIRNNTPVVLLDISSDVDTTVTPRVASFVDTGSNIKHCKNSIIQTNTNYVRSGAFPLTNTVIGARVRTTTANYARINLYGIIITKSALSDAQRIACERHVARKAGVIL